MNSLRIVTEPGALVGSHAGVRSNVIGYVMYFPNNGSVDAGFMTFRVI
jgi:hypothetical protein